MTLLSVCCKLMETISLQAFMLYIPLRSCSDISKNPQRQPSSQSAWQNLVSPECMAKLEDMFSTGKLGRSKFTIWKLGVVEGGKTGGRKPIAFRNSSRGRKRDGVFKNPIAFLCTGKIRQDFQRSGKNRIAIDFAQGRKL